MKLSEFFKQLEDLEIDYTLKSNESGAEITVGKYDYVLFWNNEKPSDDLSESLNKNMKCIIRLSGKKICELKLKDNCASFVSFVTDENNLPDDSNSL